MKPVTVSTVNTTRAVEFCLKLHRPNAYDRKLAHQRRLRREKQARWRAKHPLAAAWHAHKWNAKQRGKVVLWTREEFSLFCFETGYHLLRFDGYSIDRIEHREGYSLGNCRLLTALENSIKGGFERWLKPAHYFPS